MFANFITSLTLNSFIFESFGLQILSNNYQVSILYEITNLYMLKIFDISHYLLTLLMEDSSNLKRYALIKHPSLVEKQLHFLFAIKPI